MTTNIDDARVAEGIDKNAGAYESRVRSKRRSPFRWTLGVFVRLCIWYALLTPIFRCPSHLSELNDSSPRVCKPYLVARSYVEPHIAPYYEAYGAPYVELTRPYARTLNEKVYTPAANVAKWGYDKYGAPAFDQVQQYTQQQWERQVVPHLQSAQDSAFRLYKSDVAPHVERVEIALSPYYQKTNDALSSVFRGYVLPFCAQSRPFIGKTYTSGQDILTTTVMPYAQTSWSSVIYFANSSLWPKITGLYSENVEPQLVKIGQRLASYREGKQLRKVVDDVDSSSDQPDPTTSSVKQAESPVTTTAAEASSTPKPLSPTELAAQTREKIESDLRTWQQKFAVAADKGVEDLEDRIKVIVDSYIDTGAKSHGESLFTALEEVVQHELAGIKQSITLLTEPLPVEEAPEEEEVAQANLSSDIKQAAITIRDHAHALRQWHRTFDEEIERRVSDAVNTTLNVLDSIRDLGLQEIGIRWAWMDGVTYKDWEKYYALKAQFDGWRSQFRAVGLQHIKVEEARVLADDILGRGMDAAENAAKELARLKDVGKWKIAAREVSEDFDTRSSPPPALPKRNTTSDQVPGEESVDLDEEVPLDHQDAADRDADTISHTEPGLDDAPLSDDQDSEESPKQSSWSAPTDNEEEILSANEQSHEAEHDAERSSWGVVAADVETSDDAPSVDEPIEMLHSILNAADDKVPIKQANEPQTSDTAQNPAQPTPNYAAVEDLVSQLLDGKDPSFAEDMMKKLHAIYGKSSPIDVGENDNTPTESSTSVTETPIVEEATTYMRDIPSRTFLV
ncbi:hypothetical protein P170DRAFT_448811 [Aspergillus steynii IBT 23096]|uniref:Transcription factor hoxa13 n=1 Tax=Aspergillus steynii IBT 23096 TaxID=1392250 RepID=A0A2I2G2M5_9EURO|nr:uncharacterized protein P170DRAFT_448811 [Aspergillus steynii IBT 23096]PLB47130.1 hypothetical protein P170DRAFT_448811 [Aspergillus steynii IBT 23096]